GDIAAARADFSGDFDAAAEAVDEATQQLIAFYAGHASENGRAIDRIRHNTSLVAVVLDGAAVLMAAVMLMLAVRATRLHERILLAQNQAAAARANELDHFAARVAHDLKAPLTSVLMGVSAAQQYPQDAPRLLDRVRRASGTMNNMIDALLEFARAGSAPQRGTAAHLAPVLEAVVLSAQPSLDEAHAQLIVPPVPSDCIVGCSSGALASVLSNLVQNAIKYLGTGTGERWVKVGVNASAATVRIEVSDSGPGLPEDVHERIFEMYTREPTSAGKPGLGLGLATVKRLVEAHGGKLGVNSRIGEGACFWIELARSSVAQAPAPAGQPATRHA
ncbi:MAG TPA: HAMP domain-containing sensor histidine kinase, partial [Polyangia bacterium]|nr:HAMP domain-containing sensor histidine kinase [Polyangia bacterium]